MNIAGGKCHSFNQQTRLISADNYKVHHCGLLKKIAQKEYERICGEIDCITEEYAIFTFTHNQISKWERFFIRFLHSSVHIYVTLDKNHGIC